MLNPIKGSNDKSSILWPSALPCASNYDCGLQQWLKWRRRGNKFQTKSILFRLQELNLIARALPCCHGFYFSKVINIPSHSAPQKREINKETNKNLKHIATLQVCSVKRRRKQKEVLSIPLLLSYQGKMCGGGGMCRSRVLYIWDCQKLSLTRKRLIFFLLQTNVP